MENEKAGTKLYTVGEITRNIKKTLEGKADFNNVWIKGEVYNLTFHSSGHIYFTLKDDSAVLSVVFFKYANKNLKFKLETGMSVLAFGSITLFEKGGRYQLNVSQVRLEGIGELQQRIEQLKKKLTLEGIFDKKFKKSIPFLPKRVGVVTSPTGAAIRDILKVALRRYPNAELVLAPAKVQGDDAAPTIVKGIEELNRPENNIDVIIAGRGGGSFEDLMPFNEEIVIRAFFNSVVPIISAVGHQIDHPLSDDAADLAAPTPSAGAEMAVPVKQELFDEIGYLLLRANNALESQLRQKRMQVEGLINRRIFKEPREIINYRELLLSDLESRMINSMKGRIAEEKNRLLRVPDIKVLFKNILNNKSHAYLIALSAVEKLSPIGVMKRGYSIARDENNAIVNSINDTDVGNTINLQMHDGSLSCSVNSKKGEQGGNQKTGKN
ncbi:MAG: exodeoxyribonuclease VII large subunit [bacterium]|nr:exodeoxyribonuclease VII large subunit [bacterium]